MHVIKLISEAGSCEQMADELEEVRRSGIYVFSVAVSITADASDVRRVSSPPQVATINYFLSPTINNLNSLSSPLAMQVFYQRRL